VPSGTRTGVSGEGWGKEGGVRGREDTNKKRWRPKSRCRKKPRILPNSGYCMYTLAGKRVLPCNLNSTAAEGGKKTP